MSVLTVEGIVENGRVEFRDPIVLPERTKVYIVIPEFSSVAPARVISPRLVHPEEAAEFAKEIIEVAADAAV